MSLKLRLRAFRARNGLNRDEAADALGVSRRTLEGWEMGRRCALEFTIAKLMRELDGRVTGSQPIETAQDQDAL